MRTKALCLLAAVALGGCNGSGSADGQAQEGNVEAAADESLKGVDPGAVPGPAQAVASDEPASEAASDAPKASASPGDDEAPSPAASDSRP